jgi:hypothetical protein
MINRLHFALPGWGGADGKRHERDAQMRELHTTYESAREDVAALRERLIFAL